MIVPIALTLIFLFTVSSMTYAYAFRGEARYENFAEYIRKGWPFTTPLNSLLYIFTQKKALKPIMNINDFPELKIIQENWETIRDEAMVINNQKLFDKTKDKDSDSHYDLGFRTFYKYGWSKFYLTWYGTTHNSAKRLMPKSVEILEKIPTVNGAMLSTLPPGGQLTRHLDPMACSLRFHLGLSTPNSPECFINVDGQTYSWKDGDTLIFDETYLHFAENNSQNERIILMCDIDRLMRNWFGYLINWFYKLIAKQSVVPNTDEDSKGIINKIFSGLAPVLAKTKALKQTNRELYLLIKYTVNTTLLILIIAMFYGALFLVQLLLN